MPNSPHRLPLVDLCADDAEIRRYAALLESLDIGLAVFGTDGSLQLRNPRASSLLGATEGSWEDESGRSLTAENRLEMQVLQTRTAIRQRTIGIRRSTSTTAILCNASAFPVLAEDGSLRCVLLTLSELDPQPGETGARQRRQAQDDVHDVFTEADILLLLADEDRRTRRYGTPFSLALLAVDRFSALCAAHGAQEGERTLADIGRHLCKGLRDADVVGRFRGDHFLVILPNVRVDDAVVGLERLRGAVEMRHASDPAGPLTISAGVSEFTGEDSAMLIERVRSLLATACESGGNRLCVNLDFF